MDQVRAMAVWVVLLRGVNVGGAGKLPMAGFRAMLEGLGFGRVETYIQSGNAVFDSDLAAAELEGIIRGGIADRFSFAPECFVLSADEIGAALTDHPFQGAEGNRVHVVFLRETPAPDEGSLRALALTGDGWHVETGREAAESFARADDRAEPAHGGGAGRNGSGAGLRDFA